MNASDTPGGLRRAPAAIPLRYRVDGALVTAAVAVVTLMAATLFLIAVGLLAPNTLIDDEALRVSMLGFADSSTPVRGAIAAAAAVVGVAGGVLVFHRLARRGTASSYHIVSADEHGLVLVDREGIARIAEGAAIRAPGVLDAAARVAGAQRGPVRVQVEVAVAGGGDLKAAGEHAQRAARRAVQQLAGVDVADVIVAVEVAPTEYLERGLS